MSPVLNTPILFSSWCEEEAFSSLWQEGQKSCLLSRGRYDGAYQRASHGLPQEGSLIEMKLFLPSLTLAKKIIDYDLAERKHTAAKGRK